jgi:hypothetical protein
LYSSQSLARLNKLGPTILSDKVKGFVVEDSGVAVASTVLVILKPQSHKEIPGMVRLMGAPCMEWHSISGNMAVNTESMTMTDGFHANAQAHAQDRHMNGDGEYGSEPQRK